MARSTYHSLDILHSNQFDLVDWEMAHSLLCSVPKLFQLWVCKQVTNIAATIANVYWWDKFVGTAPSCMQVLEMCAHVLHCCHDGKVEMLLYTINIMNEWLTEAGTEPALQGSLAEYA
jgi:hypothetical protein